MSSSQTRGIILLVVLLAGASLTALVLLQPSGDTPTESNIQIVGATTTINITLSQMQDETPIIRNGSFQNSFGNIRGAGEYQGVLVSDLLEAVGGMGINDTLTVKASDGYSQTFEYSKVYPNQTIWDIQGDMVIAYMYNGTTVPDYEDGFRLMFLPEDGYYSNADANATTDPNPYAAGPQCVSNVVQIIVNPYTGPEPVLFSLNYNETSIRYTMSDLVALSSVSGEGGYKRTSGTIVGPDSYEGIPFTTLISQIPTLPDNYSVIVKAGDDWTSEYTKTIIEGTVNGYSPTGDPIGDITCTMILAFKMDGSLISTGDGGPLRVAFLNEDGNLTDGFNWAKNVVNITVVEEPGSGGFILAQEYNNDTIEFQCMLLSRFENL
ncbi:MAG: hypothetical protein ACFFEE_06595 [Candidatus Thorarchaeota archaeon]